MRGCELISGIGLRVRRIVLPLVGLALLAPPAARAESVPEGLELGPWILSPTFRTAYETSDNVFYENELVAEPDTVTRYQGQLEAAMPFRNSMFELEYRASKETFDVHSVPRETRQQFGGTITLNFKSGDQLEFRDLYRKDFARTEDVELDQTFTGEPYKSNRWEIELSRDEPGRQGYTIRVRRQDFIYEGDRNISFFDYRGFSNVFEYRQPVPGGRSWTLRYSSRRYRHYDPFEILAPKGVPFRKEKSDNVLLGLRGELGPGQPFRVSMGYGRFDYEESVLNPKPFNGYVGEAAWRLNIGARTTLRVEAVRRALPSNFESYYINNGIEARLELERVRWDTGARLGLTRNQYSGSREDDLVRFYVYWSWRVHERMRFEVSPFYANRSSNVPFADYDATGVETAIAIGWF